VSPKGMVIEMISDKDSKLLNFLIRTTEDGKTAWEPTASEDQFTTSIKGKYNIVVGLGRDGHYLKMLDAQERVMLMIRDDDDPQERVTDIFEAARRVALNVDTAIDDILDDEVEDDDEVKA
jgi:hypothetical protein